MFREICTFISDRTGFALGGALQAGRYAQNAPVRCLLVQESGGATEFYPNTDMIDMTIQVLARAANYADARADSYTVFNSIHGTSGWNLPRLLPGSPQQFLPEHLRHATGEDYLVMTIEALAAPQYLGEDDNRRHLFSTNYIFRVEEGSCPDPRESGSEA